MKTPRILFLCTGNSCRSQMAEGWARARFADRYEIVSAGIETHGLNPLAVQAMSEVGIDISNHYSKTLQTTGLDFDLVITVCGHANETCPLFPGHCRVVHQGFDDPPSLAKGARSEREVMLPYRRVRDEIGRMIETLPTMLAAGTADR